MKTFHSMLGPAAVSLLVASGLLFHSFQKPGILQRLESLERQASYLPVGSVIAYGGAVPEQSSEEWTVSVSTNGVQKVFVFEEKASPRTKWILCNGATLSVSEYSTLAGLMGAADDETTFSVPDYRGRFMRGVDLGAGIDTKVASRSLGKGVGSHQKAYLAEHQHLVGKVVDASDYGGELQFYDQKGSLLTRLKRSGKDANQIKGGDDRNDDFKKIDTDGDLYTHKTLVGDVIDFAPANVAVHYLIKCN